MEDGVVLCLEPQEDASGLLAFFTMTPPVSPLVPSKVISTLMGGVLDGKFAFAVRRCGYVHETLLDMMPSFPI